MVKRAASRSSLGSKDFTLSVMGPRCVLRECQRHCARESDIGRCATSGRDAAPQHDIGRLLPHRKPGGWISTRILFRIKVPGYRNQPKVASPGAGNQYCSSRSKKHWPESSSGSPESVARKASRIRFAARRGRIDGKLECRVRQVFKPGVVPVAAPPAAMRTSRSAASPRMAAARSPNFAESALLCRDEDLAGE